MNHTRPPLTENRFEKTRLLAYQLWQQANCPPGEDIKFWLKAEEQLFGKRGQQPGANPRAGGAANSVGKRAATPTGNGSAKSQSTNAKKAPRVR